MLPLVTKMVFFGEADVFLQLSRKSLVGDNRVYLHFETPKFQEVFLSKLTQFSQEKNVLEATVSNNEGFPQEMHVFRKLT
jgi:hypothetical protein